MDGIAILNAIEPPSTYVAAAQSDRIGVRSVPINP